MGSGGNSVVTALAVVAVGLGGCSFLIQDKDTGRPCKPESAGRRCPVGQICNAAGFCEVGDAGVVVAECGVSDPDDVTDCTCPVGATVLCSPDQICLCITLVGGLAGVVEPVQAGFSIEQARLGTYECVTQGEFNLCGGLIQ